MENSIFEDSRLNRSKLSYTDCSKVADISITYSIQYLILVLRPCTNMEKNTNDSITESRLKNIMEYLAFESCCI